MSADLYLVDSGVLLATGNHPASLLLASMAELPLLIQNNKMPLLDPETHETCYPALLPYSDNPEHLVDQAISQLTQLLSEPAHPLFLLLPESQQPQYDFLTHHLKQLPDTASLQRITPEHFTKTLNAAVHDIQQGKINRCTFFALDSLLHPGTLTHALHNKTLRTQHHADGRAAGEGCGWFTLSNTPPKNQSPILWRGSSRATNRLSENAPEENYRGLALALERLIQEQVLDTAPDTWIYSRRQIPADDLAAFMSCQYHWGTAAYEQLEQICPARQVGDLGVAALPVAIALACERLRYTPYKKTSVLITDSQPDGQHFCLLLSNPNQFQGGQHG